MSGNQPPWRSNPSNGERSLRVSNDTEILNRIKNLGVEHGM